ncbi:MAG: MBL fold metallo-hydrolase [Treponema sp.]|jgi:L-ascorbate metabolism protein UlaG (beta-lactamase superfamily)|nr:MBL fold metallo-hydrolase [Treponema sp.]
MILAKKGGKGMVNEGAYQAKAPDPVPMTREAFGRTNDTAVYWLTGAGIFLNSYGTTILIDPILSLASDNPPISEVEDTPQYTMPPVFAKDIYRVDAVLYTHADADHLGALTVKELIKKDSVFHGTDKVKERLLEIGVVEEKIISHNTEDRFKIGCVEVQMTPADHPWQMDYPDTQPYIYKPEDCCGFKFYTRNGIIWDPGDTRVLNEHFNNTDVDLLFMDFEDNSPLHHFGTENALRLANHLKQADIIMFHWGTYYAPGKPWYATDPDKVRDRIERKERILNPHPGEKIHVDYKNRR